MSATRTFSWYSERVRREVLADGAEPYRWAEDTVLAAVDEAAWQVGEEMCRWAQYDQEAGTLLPTLRSSVTYTVSGASLTVPAATLPLLDSTNKTAAVAACGSVVLPIDDRWAHSVVLLAGAKCLAMDSSDAANAELAARLTEQARAEAQS